MEQMKQEIGDTDPALLELISSPVNKWRAQRIRNNEDMWAEMIYRPESFDVPENLKRVINKQSPIVSEGDAVMFQVDLDADGQNEYLLFRLQQFGIGYSQFYYLTEKCWKVGILSSPSWIYGGDEVHDMIKNGDIAIVDPRFKHLKIGDIHLQPSANDR